MRVIKTLLAIAMLSSNIQAYADFIFSAPPRESEARGTEVYQPITDFLTKVIGERVTYRYPDNWLTYQREMQRNTYDIVFDGPHFISWRIENLQHTSLVKLPGTLEFVVVVKKDDTQVKELKQLAGRLMCGHAPPNLGTLTVLHEFSNPARQPLLLDTQGFPAALRGVLDGRCAGGILQAKLHKALDTQGDSRIVFKSRSMPNQGFSASKRISLEKQNKIAQALLSEQGIVATRRLREEFKAEKFVSARKDEFAGLAVLLKGEFGFEIPGKPGVAMLPGDTTAKR